jgi:RimJ/RimL family protein N-acetyltransferase
MPTIGCVQISPPDPPLQDELVALRPWAMDDAPGVAAACQDPEIPRWTTVPTPYSLEDAHQFLAAVTGADLENQLALAMTKADDGLLVGSMTFWIVKPGVGEFGYWTAAEARGRGYTPRALRLLARWAFDELGVPRLQLGTFPGNRSSERVAEKVGFAPEGVLRSWMDQRGERRDVRMWSLLPGELS